MLITQIGFAYDDDLADAEALLARYATLVGWAEALAAAGVASTVVHRFHRTEEFTRRGVRYLFRAVGLNRTLAKVGPDVVHVNGLNFPMQTWRCRRLLAERSAVVVQDHASGEPPPAAGGARAVRDALRRRAMKAVDGFFFTAAAQADGWRRRGFIADAQPVHEIPEASTSMQPLDPAAAAAATGIAGDPAVLWVGRLNANKSPLTILAGVERAAADLPGLTLTMVFGGGDLENEVRSRLARSPVLGARVRLAGAVPHDQLAAFYSASDLFVLGSHHEGSGYALLEACACGALPVVTDIAAFRAMVGGGAGLLWPVDDADKLASALVAAARRDRRAERARIREHFAGALSWPAVARQAIAAYEQVAAARRSARTGVVN
ncbi:MAG TPA: glycosyltransferase family 4 protein [Vicinamibacterales bacterium]